MDFAAGFAAAYKTFQGAASVPADAQQRITVMQGFGLLGRRRHAAHSGEGRLKSPRCHTFMPSCDWHGQHRCRHSVAVEAKHCHTLGAACKGAQRAGVLGRVREEHVAVILQH